MRPRPAGDGQASFDCGADVSNAGTIAALTNSRGSGGSGRVQGSAGDAIYSNSFIGPIANSGSIVGNVVTITGGSGKASGQWTPPRSTLSRRTATRRAASACEPQEARRDRASADVGPEPRH
jgi:hypothetical protein